LASRYGLGVDKRLERLYTVSITIRRASEMSTDLRNVPGCEAQNEIHQTRFWGGSDRMTCVQITQRKPKGEKAGIASDFFNHISLDKHQARALAVELMLFAEGREVEECEEFLDN
jgi:hypothetical protein